ncbi:MAG: hypothetical protein A3G25_04330 [Betaproteobacteria bacterium RIFCSPLOWO2_12_FULL_63_13]|nr:MAG: hypothetical protein A3G25_04330 [Betaproteobacteria bacterium RIFCSPLOWO2_12_FULL_63_13]
METNWVGFIGTTFVIIAYLPQVWHLISKQCSAGISLKAYSMWFISSVLLFAHAFSIKDPVFIALQSYQLGATSVILLFAKKYENGVCPVHRQ